MSRLMSPKATIIYICRNGYEPFTDWFESIRDARDRRRILARLRRLERGHLGDYKPIKNGVFELRLFFGPGYRLYYGVDCGSLVVLLCGGDKSSQASDIKKALSYWQEYLSND